MRFPSLAFAASEVLRVSRRFPLVMLSAVAAAVGGIISVEHPGEELGVRLMVTATLGLPLMTALAVGGETRGWRNGRRWGTAFLALLALGGFYLAWGEWLDPVRASRYLQFSLGSHLLAAVLPYTGRGSRNGFWQYNKTLFLRFLLAAVYALVLFLGLVIALVALDKLFGADIDENMYAHLFVVIGFLFTTPFFLGGIPRDLSILETLEDYPKGLRILSQFILLPLVAIYLAILTLYLGKIAVTRVWPSGWIGYLVSSVSAVGILSLLLVFPIQEREENRWVRTYARGFYILLIPALGMLLLALGKRIGQYAWTENRYFMVVLAVWLLGIAIYSIRDRSRNLKLVPISLCVLAFLTAFGPWGAYAVATSSQRGRLESILLREGILVEGRIQPVDHELDPDDRVEISETVRYLVTTHGRDPVRDWFEDRMAWADTVETEGNWRGRWDPHLLARRVVERMGVEYISARRPSDVMNFNYWTGAMTEGAPVAGYDHAFLVDRLPRPDLAAGERTFRLEFDPGTQALRFLEADTLLIGIPLAETIEGIRGQPRGEAPDPLDPIEVANDRVAVRLVLRNLSGVDLGKGPEVTGFQALVLVRFED